jgi:hypothetical protein
MAKKKKGIKPGDLIIFGIVMLFGFFPLGILMIILGIIWAMSSGDKQQKKHTDNQQTAIPIEILLSKTDTDTTGQSAGTSAAYTPPIQEKTDKKMYTAADTDKYTHQEKTAPPRQEEYVYTTSHTESEARDRRKKAFIGIISQHTDNVGEAIGLLRLSRKLAGIKKVVIDVSVDKDAEIMGIREKDGHIRVKTTSVKQAIDFLRKAYAQWGLKGITLHIYLKNTDTPKVETLLEIAKSTYRASEGQGGEEHVLTV